MGCGVSVVNQHPLVTSAESSECASPRAITSSDQLNAKVKSPDFRTKFRNFILHTWVPQAGKDSTDYYRSEGRNISINFYDFWLDASDYSEIPKSAFQSYRACFIFEKYLMHGASRTVPITTNVIDECSEVLFGGGIMPQEVDSTLYEAAMNEAIEFITSEVLPSFHAHESKEEDGNGGLVTSILNGVTKRRASMFNSPDRAALISIMDKILKDKIYFNTFRQFLKGLDAVHFLFAYQDLNEIEEKLTNMPETLGEQMNITRTLYYLNTYYDRYLALSAPKHLALSQATRGDCLHKLSSTTDTSIFRPMRENIYEIMVRTYLDAFLTCPSYRALVRSGRSSVAKIASTLKSPEIPDVLSAASDGSEVDAGTMAIVAPNAWTVLETSDQRYSDLNVTNNIKELKHFMLSENAHIFGGYLQKYHDITLMYFCQSCLRFKEAIFPTDIDRVNSAGAIFQRYLSRNAEEQISIPEDVRKRLMHDLFSAPQSLYFEATDFILKQTCLKYWEPFKDLMLNSDPDSSGSAQAQRSGQSSLPASTPQSITGNGSKKHHNSSSSSSSSNNNHNNSNNSHEDGNSSKKKKRGDDNDDDDDDDEEEEEEEEGDDDDDDDCTVDTDDECDDPHSSEIVTPPDMQSAESILAEKIKENFVKRNSVVAIEVAAPEREKEEPETRLIRTSFISNMLRPTRRGGIFGARASGGSYRGDAGGHSASSKPAAKPPVNPAAMDPALSTDASMFALTDTFKTLQGQRKNSLRNVSLKDLMSHPHCCGLFKAFLEKEGTSQTLLFLLEVEEYRRIPSVRYQQTFAQKIYYKFIHECAIMPLPLQQTARDQVFENLSNTNPMLFQDAVTEVMQYIEGYQFPRFARSSNFNKVIALLALDAQQPKANKRRASIVLQPAKEMTSKRSLKQILSHQYSTRYFKDYCARNYCHESILFWLDAENYQNLPGTNYMKHIAQKIYRKYISDSSILQVNISYKVKTEISRVLDNPTRCIYKKAQGEIFKLMETDALPKFLTSKEYEIMSFGFEEEAKRLRSLNGAAAQAKK